MGTAPGGEFLAAIQAARAQGAQASSSAALWLSGQGPVARWHPPLLLLARQAGQAAPVAATRVTLPPLRDPARALLPQP